MTEQEMSLRDISDLNRFFNSRNAWLRNFNAAIQQDGSIDLDIELRCYSKDFVNELFKYFEKLNEPIIFENETNEEEISNFEGID